MNKEELQKQLKEIAEFKLFTEQDVYTWIKASGLNLDEFWNFAVSSAQGFVFSAKNKKQKNFLEILKDLEITYRSVEENPSLDYNEEEVIIYFKLFDLTFYSKHFKYDSPEFKLAKVKQVVKKKIFVLFDS